MSRNLEEVRGRCGVKRRKVADEITGNEDVFYGAKIGTYGLTRIFEIENISGS
jgi:hypothetical protein